MEKLFSSFEEMCQVQGLDPNTVIPDVSCMPKELQAAAISFMKLLVGAHAQNGGYQGHKFDYNNYNQGKWYPIADMETDEGNPSGFRFDCARCGNASTRVGARLSFRTQNEATNFFKVMESDYKTAFTQ